MILKDYDGAYYCHFDAENATVDPLTIENTEPFPNNISYEEFLKICRIRDKKDRSVGYCSERPFGWVAVYASDDRLILQIDKQKWTIGDEETNIIYGHNFLDETKYEIIFGISIINSSKEFDVRYERWWQPMSEDLVDPVRAYEDLDNQDNDLLAHACDLHHKNKYIRQNVIKTYQERAIRGQQEKK